MDETQAISLIQQGDLKGLEYLVRLYQVKAVHAAYLILHDRGLAEDVVQAAFLRAVDKIAQFDASRSFGPWFLRSVVNAAIDTAERQNRWVSLEPDAEGEIPSLADLFVGNDPSLEDYAETEELCTAVRDALAHLSPEQRAVIVLRYFLELSSDDLAHSLNRPATTIQWWLRTARKRLKVLLRPVWDSRYEKECEDAADE